MNTKSCWNFFLDLQIAFSLFDKDGDGQISAEEVAETMKSLGIKIDFKDVKKMVKRVDTDGRWRYNHICFHCLKPSCILV